MKAILFPLLLFSFLACENPKSKPTIETDLKEVADTLQTSWEDGVVVEKPALTQTEALPPQLENQLQINYPGWKIPEISENYKKMLGLTAKNLIWLTGDFDGNKQEDYAAQVQVKDSVYVSAFLQQPGKDRFNHYQLQAAPLYKADDLEKGSLYYLTFLSKNDTVYNYLKRKKETLPSDAISVGMEYGINTYFFLKGKWEKLETGD